MKDVPKVYYNYKNSMKTKDLERQWWNSNEADAYENVFPLVTYIRQSQAHRHMANYQYNCMYANQMPDRAAGAIGLNSLAPYFGSTARTTFNVVKSCIDTARSKIVKQKPRPFFVTENGDWHLQQKAKRLNQFVLGLFENIGAPNGLIRESLYTIGGECFFDAAITGTGAAKMSIRGEKIVAERFLSDELVVDQYEGIYRTPRSMHQIKYIDRQVLYDLYPEAKFRNAIERASCQNPSASGNAQDMIPVIESYHLPSGPKSKDGRRVVSIQTGTLHYSGWDRPYFPFLVQRWSLKPVGFFGMGLAEELQGIQFEINKILHDISIGLRRVARPRVGLHISDANSRKGFTNEIGEFYFYKDRPPIFSTPQAFGGETYNHLDRLFNKAYELTGISQLSSTSKKPSGLDAAVALREYQDIESERFATIHMMYENFFTPQATYMALDLLDQLLEAGVDTVVQAKDGVTFQPIKYSEVKLPRDSFTVRSYPTGFLPSEPAGKFAKVQELVQAGMYSQDEARELMDFPDLKKVDRIKNAIKSATTAYIEDIIDTGVYKPIEPYQDLKLTQQLAQSYYLIGRTQGMPEDRLDLLRRVMDEARGRIEEMQAPPPMDPMAAQGIPPEGIPPEAMPAGPQAMPPIAAV